MQMKKSVVALVLLSLFLSGCGEPSASSSVSEETQSSESVSESVSEPSLPPASSSSEPASEGFPLPDVETYLDGTMSGYLLDISMNFNLATGYVYDCGFRPNVAAVKSLHFTVDDPSVIEIVPSATDPFVFDIVAKKAGNTFFTIYGDDDFTYGQQIVKVRDPLDLDAVDEYLYSIEAFVGYPGLPGNYLVSFTDPVAKTGFVEIDDEAGASNVDFTYEYRGYEEVTRMHFFDITMTSQEGMPITLSAFSLSLTGDVLYLWMQDAGEAMLAFLIPETI